ncbi:hypothetical protein LWI29_026574 [Acer saccharum]|uniref:C-JID domain-containing protein n=1 Tax=Acer saccharum TaxID=4024 RepID=A0AA39VNX1_ACESA|nr:hypothetical protein LWI29_026574 [Acer saccharum]
MNKVKLIGEGLESLPDELRYVSWPGYPLEYLPLKPEHLVDLEMPFGKLQHLWKDTKGSTASFCFPGSEIPEWLIYQNQGSSIKIDFPPHSNSNFVGFVVCFVASCESSNHIDFTDVKCECKIKDPDCDGNGQDITFNFPKIVIEHPKSDHVFIQSIKARSVLSDRMSYVPMTDPRFNTENSFFWEKARFQFSTSDSCCEVKKCGINLVYSERKYQKINQKSEVFETILMSPQRKKRKIAT